MTDIIIVEDNREIATVLKDFLEQKHYRVTVASSGEAALEHFALHGCKLFILDLMLPGIDGFRVCTKIRETSNAHILMVSARGSKEDKLRGLLTGADDYIEKPYDVDLLMAKIDGIFKRKYAISQLKDQEICLDLVKETVTVKGQMVEMTSKEFALLRLLRTRGSICRRIICSTPSGAATVIPSFRR